MKMFARLATGTLIAVLLLGSSTIIRAEAEKKKETSNKKPPEPEAKPVLVQPGAYEIDVSSETADGTEIGTKLKETHCLVETAGAANHGFAALGPDSPLRNCPTTNLRETGDSLSFEIKCTSGNPARGRAYFSVFGSKFHGRIEMIPNAGAGMVAEIQDGRRIASCPSP